MSIKRENFERVVEKRIERFDGLIKTFMGLSNKQHYEYTDEDVKKIIGHMYDSIDDVKKALLGKKKFTLRSDESSFVEENKDFINSVESFIEDKCSPYMVVKCGEKDVCGVVNTENYGLCFVSGALVGDKWMICRLMRNLSVSEALDLAKNFVS